MQLSRRSFLGTAATGLAATSVLAAETAPAPGKPRIKLGISSYSYWHFRPPKVSIETVIDKASELGVTGVDILHRQLDREDRSSLQKIKRHAFRSAVDLICLSIHQNFVMPDEAERRREVEHTLWCIEVAYELGIPSIRLNSGRWRTVKSFDRLMELRGEEPALEGFTEDDAFKWCIDAIGQCLPKAEECGVVLALENHWGLTRQPEGVLRIVDAIKSPWLGALMDTGNFLENPYEKLKVMAPQTVLVQAKTYFGGGEWYTLDLDYKRVAQILAAANYAGYVAIEFEGKENPDTGVPKSVHLLREAFGL